jgi:hypothetical protein
VAEGREFAPPSGSRSPRRSVRCRPAPLSPELSDGQNPRVGGDAAIAFYPGANAALGSGRSRTARGVSPMARGPPRARSFFPFARSFFRRSLGGGQRLPRSKKRGRSRPLLPPVLPAVVVAMAKRALRAVFSSYPDSCSAVAGGPGRWREVAWLRGLQAVAVPQRRFLMRTEPGRAEPA